MEAQGEQLLQELITHEQKLVAKVEDARREAAEILKQAQADADRILSEARREAEQRFQKQAEKTKAEGDAIREEVLAAAREEVAKIERSAKARRNDAVRLVLDRAMP